MEITAQPDNGATRSQAHLARQLGLARMTVQRALAGHASVRPETRDRILRCAQRHGYRPNVAALSMRSGRFGTIAVIGATEKGIHHLPRHMLRGVHEAASQRGWRVLIAEFLRTDLDDPNIEPQALRQLATDGLLIHYYRAVPEELLARVRSYHLPAVWMNASHNRDCVHPDDRGAGRLAIRHLLALGHRRIAYVSHHGARHDSILARCQGAEDALRRAGLTLAVRQLTDAYTTADGPRHVLPWLSAADRPTAVICYEQQETVSVCLAAASLGLRIPQDLSVIGYSSAEMRVSTGLPISTFIVPFEELGQRAVSLLEKQLLHEDGPAKAVALPFAFVDFGSTCAPTASFAVNRVGRRHASCAGVTKKEQRS